MRIRASKKFVSVSSRAFAPEVTKDSGDLRKLRGRTSNEIITPMAWSRGELRPLRRRLRSGPTLKTCVPKAWLVHIIKNFLAMPRAISNDLKGPLGKEALSLWLDGRAPPPSRLTGDLLWGLVTNGSKKRQVDLTFDEVDPSLLETLKDQNRAEINEFLQSEINPDRTG